MKVEKTFFIEAPAQILMDAMRDPQLIEKEEKARDALNVEVNDVEKTDEKHLFIIKITNYAQGLTGLDKSKTEINQSTVTWDISSTRNSWVWKGTNEHADKVSISGANILKPMEDGTEVTFQLDVEVRVPIIGKKIAKKIANGFQAEWPKHVANITAYAKERA